MYFASMQDVLAFVAALAIGFVTVFLCWALFEIARLVRQANEVVTETREKIGRMEKLILVVVEKISSTSHYLGFIAEGARQLLSHLRRRDREDMPPKEKKKKKTLKNLLDLENEGEEDV